MSFTYQISRNYLFASTSIVHALETSMAVKREKKSKTLIHFSFKETYRNCSISIPFYSYTSLHTLYANWYCLYLGSDRPHPDLQWDRVKGSESYVIEKSTDSITADGWKQAGIATKSSHTVLGLASGTKCWFRVAAIGAAGQGPWSDPAVKVVP